MCRARPGPSPSGQRKARRTCIFIVQDDTGFGQMGCYGSPIATPNIDALAKNGLRSTTSTPPPCARRPAPACLTGRNHHSNAMACITEGSTGFPGLQRPRPARQRLAVRDAAPPRLDHVRHRQMAPDAPRTRTWAATASGGRSAAASIASTASWAARPISIIPGSPTTTTSSSRRRRRRRAITMYPTWWTRPRSSSPT